MKIININFIILAIFLFLFKASCFATVVGETIELPFNIPVRNYPPSVIKYSLVQETIPQDTVIKITSKIDNDWCAVRWLS